MLVASFVSDRHQTARDNAELIDVDRDPPQNDPLIPPIGIIDEDVSSDPRAHFHPHGDQICASGCAASNHPTETLTVDQFDHLAFQFDVEETNEGLVEKKHAALESLLYFGPQTRRMLDRFPHAISSANRSALAEQLKTNHARISIRVVDEHGVVRSWIPPTRVPFDRRHVFEMETERLQPHVASGTIKRVGVDRLWTRL